jgi:hypothetical protein
MLDRLTMASALGDPDKECGSAAHRAKGCRVGNGVPHGEMSRVTDSWCDR